MNSTRIFLDDDRLRPIWRFFLSVVFLFAVFVFVEEIVGAVFLTGNIHPSLFVALFWQSLVVLVAIIAVFKLMTAVFDRRPLGSVGLAFHSRWWRELGRGLAVGAAMLFARDRAGVGLRLRALHVYSASDAAGGIVHLAWCLPWRRPMRKPSFADTRSSGWWSPLLPWGPLPPRPRLFGLVHLANPHRTWISTLNTALVGIPFAIAYLRTRSLWMPIGMHFIWNFLLGFFLGLPVSGLTVPASVFTARVRGPVWLTGGDYGPEGGLLAMGAILLVTVYLSFTKSIYTSEEMKALVFAPVESRGA